MRHSLSIADNRLTVTAFCGQRGSRERHGADLLPQCLVGRIDIDRFARAKFPNRWWHCNVTIRSVDVRGLSCLQRERVSALRYIILAAARPISAAIIDTTSTKCNEAKLPSKKKALKTQDNNAKSALHSFAVLLLSKLSYFSPRWQCAIHIACSSKPWSTYAKSKCFVWTALVYDGRTTHC